MTTVSRPAHTEVPALSTEMEDLFEDLSGFHPGIEQILSGLRHIALERHTTDQTATLLTVLGGEQHGLTDVAHLMALVIERLGDPTTNPALRSLSPELAQQARKHTRLHAEYDRGFAPRDLTARAAHAIGGC